MAISAAIQAFEILNAIKNVLPRSRDRRRESRWTSWERFKTGGHDLILPVRLRKSSVLLISISQRLSLELPDFSFPSRSAFRPGPNFQHCA